MIQAVRKLLAMSALAAAWTSLAGCSAFIGDMMVESPNNGVPLATLGNPSPTLLAFHRVDQQFRVEVGPPDASLLVWVVEPIVDVDLGPPPPPRGTILIIHGYHNQMVWLLGKARAFSRCGYRTVLMDLRGNGDSTGDWNTFGVQESRDLVQVVDALDGRGLLSGPLGVWGISYGAATAIQFAARDPRVKAVVAVAPFSSMREVVPQFTRAVLPGVGAMIPQSEFDRMIADNAARASFDPQDADAALAAGRSDAPLLILHGEWDRLVPPEHSARIASEARGPVKRLLIPATGHISIYFDFSGTVERESVEWFERELAGDRQLPSPRLH